MRRILGTLAALFFLLPVYAQVNGQQKANYRLAARFSPKKLDKMVFSLSVDPHWLKKSNRFWYAWETSEGRKWYIVDPVRAVKQSLFDNAILAAKITAIVKDPFDSQHLDIDSIRFIRDENWIRFQVKSSEEVEKKDTAKKEGAPAKEKKTFFFDYNLLSGELTELKDFARPVRKPAWASISPDSQKVVFVKNYNLWWMDRVNYEKALKKEDDSTISETQLTTDGEENYSYQTENPLSGNGENNVDKEKNKNKRKPAFLFWSPDSRAFALVRSDNRRVHDLWVINNLVSPRPALETYKYWMPGEKESATKEIVLFTWDDKKSRKLNLALFKDQELGILSAMPVKKDRDDEYSVLKWLGTASQLYFTRTSRDLKKLDFGVVDVKSGMSRILVEERMNTYVETRRPALIGNGAEFIHWSERDGWGHFYLYDSSGKLINQITKGAYHSEEIAGVDEKNRVLYFMANGKETGEDPYYEHLYRVNFDGSGLKLLNPGEYDHDSNLDDDEKFFVDNYSRVNTIPRSVLFDNTGRKIMDLETADLKNLFAAGYRFPEPFSVKADDGITDLYGVMYKPYDFDSSRKYPLIEYVYPGPQTEAVNKSFSRNMDRTDRLAQMGFIVITVGNRGGHPGRSKWYHNYGYGNLRDYGLADKKYAAEQLADRFPFIDLDRVGIHGHSGGGFMSTAAMLVYPDFFKVAVSSSGNHENNVYNRWWSEKHNGVKEQVSNRNDTSFLYEIEKNSDLAKNLRGHLLLATGDQDNNVNPANTIRMANALIKANKRFDFLLLPGQRHGYGNMSEYFFWSLADYYAKWLLGDFSQTVDIVEMNREEEKSK